MAISDQTEGLIEILNEISHDPDDYDDFDLREYIESLPNVHRVLLEFAQWVHADYL